MSAWMVMQYKGLSANSNLGRNQLCRGALAGIASGQPTQMLKDPNLTPKGLKGWTNQRNWFKRAMKLSLRSAVRDENH
jgi:hypothetical protein